jgi:predicted nucleotidyltransferase
VERSGIEAIGSILTGEYPSLQAVYLFGSAAEAEPGEAFDGAGDIDIALLLPVEEAQRNEVLIFADAKTELEDVFSRPVDLINLRMVSVVFRKEIIETGRLIHAADIEAVDTFEMLTISFYQKLNEERKEILDEFFRSKRAFEV